MRRWVNLLILKLASQSCPAVADPKAMLGSDSEDGILVVCLGLLTNEPVK